jgi:hypothetical protein
LSLKIDEWNRHGTSRLFRDILLVQFKQIATFELCVA